MIILDLIDLLMIVTILKVQVSAEVGIFLSPKKAVYIMIYTSESVVCTICFL